MLRTQQIPARYVIGFRVVDRNAEGIFEVRRNNAHAWVEAYIEGSGWITFEPTPAFTAPDVALLNRFENREERSSDTYLDEMLLLPQQGREIINATLGDGMREAEGYVTTLPFLDRLFRYGSTEVFKWILKNFAILTLILFIGRIPYCHFKAKKYFDRIKQLDHSNSVICLYDNILKLIELQGLLYLVGETHYEYANRIKREVYDGEHSLYEITQSFMLAKYSEELVGEEQVDKMLIYLSYIEKKLSIKLGKYRYLFKKYIAGNIYRLHKWNVKILSGIP